MNYLKVKIEPLSLNQLKKKYPDLFWAQDWYKDEDFAKQKPKAETLYIGDDILDGSLSRTYSQQEAMLSRGVFIPTINQLIQMAITFHKQSEKKFICDYWLRTSSVAADGYHVELGASSDGLGVDGWYDSAGSSIGVAAARKSLKLEPGKLETIEALKIEGEQYELASYGPKYSDGSRQASLRLVK